MVLPLGKGQKFIPIKNSTAQECLPIKQNSRLFQKSGAVELVRGKISDFDDDNETSSSANLIPNSMFVCPTENCSARFRTERWYQNHVDGGKCFVKLRHESITGCLKRMWFSKFSNSMDTLSTSFPGQDNRYLATFFGGLHVPKLPLELALKPTELEEAIIEGFALFVRKKANRLTEDQVGFVRTIFNQGQESGNRATPAFVVERMRSYKRNGRLVFPPGHRLDEEQIKSLFGRFFKDVKRQQAEGTNSEVVESIARDIEEGNGICSAEDADTFDAEEDAVACSEMFEALKTDADPAKNHPIKVRYYNFCSSNAIQNTLFQCSFYIQ